MILMAVITTLLKSQKKEKRVEKLSEFKKLEKRTAPYGNPFSVNKERLSRLALEADELVNNRHTVHSAISETLTNNYPNAIIKNHEAEPFKIMHSENILDRLNKGGGITDEEFSVLAVALARKAGYNARFSFMHSLDSKRGEPSMVLFDSEGCTDDYLLNPPRRYIATEIIDDAAVLAMLYLNSVIRMINKFPETFSDDIDGKHMESVFSAATIGHTLSIARDIWGVDKNTEVMMSCGQYPSKINSIEKKQKDIFDFLPDKEFQVKNYIYRLCDRARYEFREIVTPGPKYYERSIHTMFMLQRQHKKETGCSCYVKVLGAFEMINSVIDHLHNKEECPLQEMIH